MSKIIPCQLNKPQFEFINLPHKFRAFVGGYGSGKTWVGCTVLGQQSMQFPKVNTGYFAPTYPQIRDIFYPTVEEVFFNMGLKIKINQGNKEVHVYSGRQYRNTILCRSMDNPSSIIGFKIGHAIVDEIDTMAMHKADQAWKKILARMRYKIAGLKNGVDITTTPEGFNFVYDQFVKQVRDKPKLANLYGIAHASTYDNEANLNDDYIESLLASYPPQLVEAYLKGLFVNLASGTVYHTFDRKLNATDIEMQSSDTVVFVGMDFNVGKMAAVIHVMRGGLPYAVDEVVNAYDTPDMIRILKERLWKYEQGRFVATRQVRVYPDASGGSRKSVNASVTDLALLKGAGFNVIANPSNPPVKDRINSVNAMFLNSKGERRYKVNIAKCPTYADCLEQQIYASNGEPDKTSGHDHINEAGGYFINMQYPIIKRSSFVINTSTGR